MPAIRDKLYVPPRKTKPFSKNAPKKPRKYSIPSYLYVTLLTICILFKDALTDERGYTMAEIIEKAFEVSKFGKHKLGKRADQAIRGFVLVFRAHGYLEAFDYITDQNGEVDIVYRALGPVRDSLTALEEAFAESEQEASGIDHGRKVFVALCTHLRETVKPETMQEIVIGNPEFKVQQNLIYEKLLLERKVTELQGQMTSNERKTPIETPIDDGASTSTEVAMDVRPAPRRLGELETDSLYMDDVEMRDSPPKGTPTRPAAQSSNGVEAYPSPNSLPRPARSGPSLQSLSSPSRGCIRTPPRSPRNQNDDDDEDDEDSNDGRAVRAYLLNLSDSFRSEVSVVSQPVRHSVEPTSQSERRLLELKLKKLRRRNGQLFKAFTAARKDLVKQRVETRKGMKERQEADEECVRIRDMYNVWAHYYQETSKRVAHLKPI